MALPLARRLLGRTGLEVTELCFGALPMGPLQKYLTLEEMTAVVRRALEGGINFVDTAQVYRTYAPIREAMRETGLRPVIATKSAAATYEEMEAAVREALDALALDSVDIFHLHAARADEGVFAARAGALQCLLDCKKRGLIKAVGISTHHVGATAAAAARDEIDVVFPIYNREGRGILGGGAAEMARAIEACHAAGKGVYLMKVLGGGTLLGDYAGLVAHARRAVSSHSIAVGMVTEAEVDYNIAFFTGEAAGRPLPDLKGLEKQVKVVTGLCRGCGTCLPACHSAAIVLAGGKARIDAGACLRCGYCTAACPEFAIRVV